MKLVKFFAAAVAAVAMLAACEPANETPKGGDDDGFVTLEFVKVYCDVTATGWETVGIWAWNLDDTNINYTGGTWPGEALTDTEEVNGVLCYVWNAPKEVVGQKIGFIVNQFVEGGEQTEDIQITVTDGLVITLTEKAESGKWLATGGEVVVPEEKPEPVIVFGDHTYGVIGSFAASDDPTTTENVGWEKDVQMNIVDGWAVATVELEANDEFKVRLDGAWDDSYGFAATEEMAEFPIDGTQFAATYNAGNLKVAEAGTYEVSFTIDGENEYLKVLKK